jgi:hypothetical protein
VEASKYENDLIAFSKLYQQKPFETTKDEDKEDPDQESLN